MAYIWAVKAAGDDPAAATDAFVKDQSFFVL
jgi:hypothetical protein